MEATRFFEKLLRELIKDCFNGRIYYRTWQRLNKTFEGEADAIGIAISFFVSTAFAHYTSARLYLT